MPWTAHSTEGEFTVIAVSRREAIKVAIAGSVSIGLSVAGGVVASKIAAGIGGKNDYVETYRGRSIWISSQGDEFAAHIDGRRLHLMKYGDDAYLSSLCHYEMAPSPLVAARKAVDELRGANLLPGVGHHA
jgi:hypothetical protein